MRIALLTYSTKPRGGVVHTLALAEALVRAGAEVDVWSLALDGATILAVLSAWPASVTRRAATLVHDRQTRLFDLYDQARAAENQVVVLSSNQSGPQAVPPSRPMRDGALRRQATSLK